MVGNPLWEFPVSRYSIIGNRFPEVLPWPQVDPYCSNIWNDASYISSADGCKEVHQRCPAAALGQCGVRDDHCTAWHEKLEYKDCDGDAYLDPVCTTSLGDGISIYRSAELCRRTEFVQCVRPIFLPMQTGGWQCPYLGLGKLTSSQYEIAAKMEDYTFQSFSSTYSPGGCFQSSWDTTKLYYNTAVNDMRSLFATPWCQMTFYFRDTNCPSNMISQSECSAAAAQLGATYKGTQSWWNEQPGCLKASDGLVYFNTDGSGGRERVTRALNWHNPPFMMLCRSNDFVWVQRTLVADEGNALAENGYVNIENCNWLMISVIFCHPQSGTIKTKNLETN